MTKVATNSEAQKDTDVIPFETILPLVHENTMVGEHRIQGFARKTKSGKVKADIDVIRTGEIDIKPDLEMTGGTGKHRRAARKFVQSLFDGEPGTKHHEVELIVDYNKPIFSNILNTQPSTGASAY
jgi:hypothetical protein